MSLDPAVLAQLCEAACLTTRWEDAFGKQHDVEPEDIHAILKPLGLDADTDAQARERMAALEIEANALPPLLTADAGGELALPLPAGAWRLEDEAGELFGGWAEERDGRAWVRLPEEPGYYRLEMGGRSVAVAAAPARCFTLADALGGSGRAPRAWGLAQQLYALRRAGDGGVGDFRALAEFVREAAGHGADAVSISPVHAQFSADPDRFSPYAPSSRIMLNVLHIAADAPAAEAARLEALELVEWPAVARDRLARLHEAFSGQGDDPAFAAWRAAEGEKLEAHALFEALHAHLWRETGGGWHWREWPAGFETPHAERARAFGVEHARTVSFHAWLQYRADQELATAQTTARDAGMAIGLISDLAVGTDSGGSHCWSRQGETLLGLTVGAPPDLLQRDGQAWGITAFSGRGLRQNGFRAFIEMLQGAMRHAGGVRIDHAMGLNRLWILPEGARAARGIYLNLPESDLLRLVRLESWRNRALVLGEDLGTVPAGFPDRLQQAGVDGMRVLWFEKDGSRFRPPSRWTQQASAMTSTHDLPTVAGWWKGIDIQHRRGLGGSEADERREHSERGAEREALWSALCESGAAMGPQPPTWDSYPVVDAALAQVGGSACELAMIPTEDVLALEEQPNVPGTTNEHPNWRRRLSAQVGSVLEDPHVTLRLQRLDGQRRRQTGDEG